MLKFQNNNTTVPASFEDFFLTTYVIVDELYHRFAPTKVINRRHLFPQICSRSRFNRTRRALMQTTELLRQKQISSFPVPISPYCIIDSFPLAVCKFGRARYCKAFRSDGADYGKCPSKKETYFGYKVHALVTLKGYITAFEITPASTDDREGLRDLMQGCSNLTVLADKGYVGENLMQEMKKQSICL